MKTRRHELVLTKNAEFKVDVDKLRNRVSLTTKCKTPQESVSNEEGDTLYNSHYDVQETVDIDSVKLHSGMLGESSSSSSGPSDNSMRTASESEDYDGMNDNGDGRDQGSDENSSNEEMSQDDDSEQDDNDEDDENGEDGVCGNVSLDEQMMVGLNPFQMI